MTTPQYYIDLLAHMPVNRNNGMPAPHKAVLLLTIIDMIEAGEISSPYINITESLKSNFKRVWKENVTEHCNSESKLSYPFFHLSSSPFWELIKTPSYRGHTAYSSMVTLESDFSGAIIDENLFRLMKNPITRDEIKALLKSVYLDNKNGLSRGIGFALLIALVCAVA